MLQMIKSLFLPRSPEQVMQEQLTSHVLLLTTAKATVAYHTKIVSELTRLTLNPTELPHDTNTH